MVVMFALRVGVILDYPALVWQMAIPVVLFFILLLIWYTSLLEGLDITTRIHPQWLFTVQGGTLN